MKMPKRKRPLFNSERFNAKRKKLPRGKQSQEETSQGKVSDKIRQSTFQKAKMDFSSDDEELMPRVFAVDDMDGDIDLAVPPTSGQEYLRRVKLEAKQHPNMTVAELNPKILIKPVSKGLVNGVSLLPAPKGFAPNLEWQMKQVAEFSELRKNLSEYKKRFNKEKTKTRRTIPLREDYKSWCRLCFGEFVVQQPWQDESSSDEQKVRQGSLPLLSIICHMNQPTVAKVLEYHINWFDVTGFSEHQGRWFYALLAALEKPVEPGVYAQLRSLVWLCSKKRATLETADDELLSHLNIVICLVARVFDQADMADM